MIRNVFFRKILLTYYMNDPLIPSCIMLRNGQTYFKNFQVWIISRYGKFWSVNRVNGLSQFLRKCYEILYYQVKTSQLICNANHLTGFYVMAWSFTTFLKHFKMSWKNIDTSLLTVEIFCKALEMIGLRITWTKNKNIQKHCNT